MNQRTTRELIDYLDATREVLTSTASQKELSVHAFMVLLIFSMSPEDSPLEETRKLAEHYGISSSSFYHLVKLFSGTLKARPGEQRKRTARNRIGAYWLETYPDPQDMRYHKWRWTAQGKIIVEALKDNLRPLKAALVEDASV